MDSLGEEIRKRRCELDRLEAEIGVPGGILTYGKSLHVSLSHGKNQYYIYEKGKRRYLKKYEIKLAEELAQLEYDNELLIEINREKDLLRDAEQILNRDKWQACYAGLPKGKQELVKKRVFSDEEYAKKWQEVEYTGNPYPFPKTKIETDKKERVRSKSEKMIADRLNYRGIPYRYEYPFHCSYGNVLYPDFMILNVRTREEWYLEHLGMMSDPNYAFNNIQKLETYEREGLWPGKGLLLTFEVGEDTLDTRLLDHMINEFLI